MGDVARWDFRLRASVLVSSATALGRPAMRCTSSQSRVRRLALALGAFVLSGMAASPVGGQVTIAPQSFVFNSTAGTPNPGAQPLSIQNNGSSVVAPFSMPITYTAGEPTGWLLVGGLPSSLSPNSQYTASVQVAAGTLPAGSYSALLGSNKESPLPNSTTR